MWPKNYFGVVFGGKERDIDLMLWDREQRGGEEQRMITLGLWGLWLPFDVPLMW